MKANRLLRCGILPAVILSVVLPLSSCRFTGNRQDIAPYELKNIDTMRQARAMELRREVSAYCRETGVFISKNTIASYRFNPAEPAEKCALLGISDVYLEIAAEDLSESRNKQDIRNLVAALNHKRIRSWLVINEIRLFGAEKAAFWSSLSGKTSDEKIAEKLNPLLSFVKNSEGQERMAGIVFTVAPHELTNAAAPQALLYAWSDNAYGIGLDNDILMEKTFAIIEYLRKESAPLPLMLLIQPFFHENAVQGKTSRGKISDFMKYSDAVIINANSSSPKKAVDFVNNELSGDIKPDTLMICFKTSRRLFGEETVKESFTGKPWMRFIKEIKYIVKKAAPHKSFKGIVFMDFEGLEKLWEKED